MNRVCTICSVPVGDKHKRKIAYIWKSKPRNLIQVKKEIIAKLKAAKLEESLEPKN